LDLTSIHRRVSEMEKLIDILEADLPSLKNFILPNGCLTSASSHFTRAICRRAEREVVRFFQMQGKSDERITAYLNRLSDVFFVYARFEHHQAGKNDAIWKG
jgi:cob(I)alamin adenosyltransferase